MLEIHVVSFYDVGAILILILRISLTITAILGFGFYLWYLKTSDDQSQSRLLNIFNGYLSLICIGFTIMLLSLVSQQEQDKHFLFFIRINGVSIISVSTIFPLISWATVLNHFKPGLYLDISLSWSHKIAIPLLFFAVIIAEQAVNFSCPEQFFPCEVHRIRTIIMIPATLTSLLCQLLVIIDDIWGWRKIYRRLKGLCSRQNNVSPANDGDNIPAQGFDQQLVSFIF